MIDIEETILKYLSNNFEQKKKIILTNHKYYPNEFVVQGKLLLII